MAEDIGQAFGHGVDAGSSFIQHIQALAQLRQQKAAEAASVTQLLQQSVQQGIASGQIPPPGGASVQPQGPMAPQVNGPPGSQPMPPQGGPPPPQGPGGVQPMGGQPPPQMQRPPMPSPQQPPMGGGPMGGPGAPPPNTQAQFSPGGPPALSGVADPSGGGVIQDSQKTLAAMAQSIKASNPNIDPHTLIMAMQQQIGLMKGIQPEMKDAMSMQLGMAKQQTQMQMQIDKLTEDLQKAQAVIAGRGYVADTNQTGATTRQGMKDDNQITLQQMKGKVAEAVEQMRASATMGAAGTRAGAQISVAQIQAKSRDLATQYGGDTRMWAAEIAAAARAYSTQAGGAPTDKPAPAAPPKPQFQGGAPPSGDQKADLIRQAQDAVRRGAPKDKVIQRLRQQGVNVRDL